MIALMRSEKAQLRALCNTQARNDTDTSPASSHSRSAHKKIHLMHAHHRTVEQRVGHRCQQIGFQHRAAPTSIHAAAAATAAGTTAALCHCGLGEAAAAAVSVAVIVG